MKAALLERALPRPRGPLRAAERPHHRGRALGADRGARPRPQRPDRVPTRSLRNRLGARLARRRGGDVVPPVHGHGPGPARPPRALPRHAAHRGGAGDLVECGTGRGGGAIFMRAYLEAHELPDGHVFVADRFRASPTPADDARRSPAKGWPASRPTSTSCATASTGSACSTIASASSRGRSTPRWPTRRSSRSRCCASVAASMATPGPVLDRLYDRLAVGGFVIVDDRTDSVCHAARRGVPSRPWHHGTARAGRLRPQWPGASASRRAGRGCDSR